MVRLSQVVLAANKDKDFALILAQRETTKAVKEGFERLTDAVQQLERNLVASIEDLQKSVVAEIQKSMAIQQKILQGVNFIATKESEKKNEKAMEEHQRPNP